MEVRELRAFTAVAEEGSVSAAARRLHLSQSALSQTVQSLERQLGVQLLRRSSTGVTATEAGRILLREARALIAHHDRVVAAVAGGARAKPRAPPVGGPPAFAARTPPAALAGLRAARP